MQLRDLIKPAQLHALESLRSAPPRMAMPSKEVQPVRRTQGRIAPKVQVTVLKKHRTIDPELMKAAI